MVDTTISHYVQKVRKIGENDDDSTDSEDEEMEDYTSNRENINVLIRGRESSKAKDKERPKKEGSESKDSNETSNKEPKVDKLSKLRSVLKTVADGYELGKRYSTANKINVDPPERACMLKETQSTGTIMNLTSEEEGVTGDTSEEDYHSCEEDESLSML